MGASASFAAYPPVIDDVKHAFFLYHTVTSVNGERQSVWLYMSVCFNRGVGMVVRFVMPVCDSELERGHCAFGVDRGSVV